MVATGQGSTTTIHSWHERVNGKEAQCVPSNEEVIWAKNYKYIQILFIYYRLHFYLYECMDFYVPCVCVCVPGKEETHWISCCWINRWLLPAWHEYCRLKAGAVNCWAMLYIFCLENKKSLAHYSFFPFAHTKRYIKSRYLTNERPEYEQVLKETQSSAKKVWLLVSEEGFRMDYQTVN